MKGLRIASIYISGGLSEFVVCRRHLSVPVGDLVSAVAGDESGDGQLHLVGRHPDLGHRRVVVAVLQVVQVHQLVLLLTIISFV